MNRYKKFYMNLLGIKYKRVTEIGEYDRHANLCSTIALSKAVGISFDKMYDIQCEYGKKNRAVINSVKHVIDPILKDNGYQKLKESHKNITVGEFMYTHKEGQYVILTPAHIEFYKNGIRYIAPINSDIIMNLDSWLLEKLSGVWYK